LPKGRKDFAASTENGVMKHKSPSTIRLALYGQTGLGQIRVDMEPFFDFSFSISEDLEDLVQRWSHLAAPNATRYSRRLKRKLPK
jgi:hypothetical protein